MIIQNLVDDFYRKLSPSRNVLILCGLDVDALAATRPGSYKRQIFPVKQKRGPLFEKPKRAIILTQPIGAELMYQNVLNLPKCTD